MNMPDILKEICATKRDEIEQLRRLDVGELEKRAREQQPTRGFRDALTSSPGVALIAEVKKASPSAGLIRNPFEPVEIARSYERGGARCLSVLTDEKYFKGGLDYLRSAREATDLPVLRKDFILDEIQVVQSRAWGADCILLIVAALPEKDVMGFMERAVGFGMDVLVEVHDESELEVAMDAGAGMIGINNRDLRTFEVDLDLAANLAKRIPEDVCIVAESGIEGRADVERLKESGVDAILVGESLMRSQDIEEATQRLSDV
jgi:indole-3-glycerol phosphate synthase